MCDLPFTRAIERGEESSSVEVRLHREDGTDQVAMTAASPIRDKQGRVIEAVPVFLDVTERIQAEEAMRASQESLAQAQEVAQLGKWDHDLPTGQLHWTDKVYGIFGVAPQASSWTHDAFLHRVHPDDRERVTRAIQVALT
jgi:PAS domain-containing protein